MTAEFSLNQLAELVGIHPRTIRSYVQMGLLRGPDTLGRNARYGQDHLERLKAIKVLRDQERMPLADIRRTLLTLAAKEIVEIGSRLEPSLSEIPKEASQASSALDLIHSFQERLGRAPDDLPEQNLDLATLTFEQSSVEFRAEEVQLCELDEGKVHSSPLVRLLDLLGGGSPQEGPTRRSTAEQWTKVEVTPDLHLLVRQVESKDDLGRYERLADLLREILLGGKANE
jgi:DNA-binding transcriptional MerR regulator